MKPERKRKLRAVMEADADGLTLDDAAEARNSELLRRALCPSCGELSGLGDPHGGDCRVRADRLREAVGDGEG